MHAEAFLYVADSLGLDSRATGLRRRSTCGAVPAHMCPATARLAGACRPRNASFPFLKMKRYAFI